MKASELAWGLKAVKLEAPALWGARCILVSERDVRGRLEVNVDVVWDRQGAQGEEPDLSNLLERLNGKAAIQSFRLWAAREFELAGDETRQAVFEGVRFHAMARSEYLYVTAHLEPAVSKLDRAFRQAQARGTL